MKFTLKNQPNSTPVIEWEAVIDKDGDLRVMANDVDLFYVNSKDGTVVLYCISEYHKGRLPGFVFNKDTLSVE